MVICIAEFSLNKSIKSSMFRKIVFVVFFLGFVPFSGFVHYPIIEWKWKIILRLSGVVIIIITAAFAIYVHSLFPRRHRRPEDFEHLLVDGPYHYVRHPFYSAFIVMGFGIALYFLSIPRIIFNVFSSLCGGNWLIRKRKNFLIIMAKDTNSSWKRDQDSFQ